MRKPEEARLMELASEKEHQTLTKDETRELIHLSAKKAQERESAQDKRRRQNRKAASE